MLAGAWASPCLTAAKAFMVLTTARLTIRPFVLEDAPFILRLVNDPDFLLHIGDRGVRDLDGAVRYLRDGPLASYARHGFGLWHVARTADRAPLGMVGLLTREWLDGIDLGFAFLPEHRGAGYAREAAGAVLDHAWTLADVTRVLAIVSPGNEASTRLLERLGFTSRGVVRAPGAEQDTLLFEAHRPRVVSAGTIEG